MIFRFCISFVLVFIINLSAYSQNSKAFQQVVEFEESGTHYYSAELHFDPIQNSEVYLSTYAAVEYLDQSVYYQLKIDDNWGEWKVLNPFVEAKTEGRTVWFAGMISQNFSSVRFRTDEYLQNLNIRMYSSSNIESTGNTLLQSANCNCIQPLVCNRSCWCPNGQCPPPSSYSYTTINHIVVHHSAGSNSSSNYPAVVEAIWDFHVNTNGWDDIGYNWLIDPNGEIYTGRGDSTVGAHFSCMNSETTGICLLGNFSNQSPTDTALASLAELIAWIACKYNIAPAKTSWHAPSQLQLDNVAGHSHGNSSTSPSSCAKGTVCPGDSLFARLQEVADSAAAKMCMGNVNVNEKESINKRLLVYPNPVSTYIFVAVPHSTNGDYQELRVLSLSGKILINKVLKGEGDFKLDVSMLNSGMYFLQLSSNTISYSQSFIKL